MNLGGNPPYNPLPAPQRPNPIAGPMPVGGMYSQGPLLPGGSPQGPPATASGSMGMPMQQPQPIQRPVMAPRAQLTNALMRTF